MMIGPRGQLSVVVYLFAWANSQDIIHETRKCPFSNTVDLANSTKHNNGSITYEGLLIPPHWIEEYDEVVQNGELVNVSKHKRGCICEVKPCVNLCCSNPKANLNLENGECLSELEEYTYTPKTNITVKTTSGLILKQDFNDFAPLYGFPCTYFPVENELDVWYLNENGSVHLDMNEEDFQLGKYCLHPVVHLNSKEYVYKLYSCAIQNELTGTQIAITYIMALSAVCMVVTIAIYLLTGKRTEHQNLFISYLITLCVSYLIVVINNSAIVSIGICYTIGYIGYFAVMATFFLLTVISVSMWNNFRSSNFYTTHTKSKSRLIICFLFSFGGAAMLTLVTVLAEFSSLGEHWKPRIGVYTCWILTQEGNSAYIYLYGPMIVLIVINFVMFILTSVRIYKLKKEVNRVKISKNFHSVQKKFSFGNEFSLYLRIFFTMGICWILEILSYTSRKESYLSISSDFINAAQGIIMFILFGNVQLLYKRFLRKRKSDTQNYCTEISDVRQTGATCVSSVNRLLRNDKV